MTRPEITTAHEHRDLPPHLAQRVSRRTFSLTAIGSLLSAIGLVFVGRPAAALSYRPRFERGLTMNCEGSDAPECDEADSECPWPTSNCWCEGGGRAGQPQHCCEYMCGKTSTLCCEYEDTIKGCLERL